MRTSMKTAFGALAAFMVACAGTAQAAPEKAAEPAKADEVAPDQPISQTVIDVAGWVIATGDHRGLPFAIVDKTAAQVFVFGEDGKLRGLAPALLGSALGDHSAPGVGDVALSAIPAEDRTTPAGRFYAAYGPAPGGKKVLWVDYASAVSIHPLAETDARERRLERLTTPTPEDNRVTHGCINVSPAFYEEVVRATFKKEGVFYVLPEADPIADALPAFAAPKRAEAKAKKRRR